MPAQCTFTLNGRSMSTLNCSGLGSFPAFSGNGNYKNNPAEVSRQDSGPLPKGRYYIVDRESGGLTGRIRDFFHNFGAGTTVQDWFALYRNDGRIDDTTAINGVTRGAFRLHPAGRLNLSKGCVTLPNASDFYRLRNFLKAQPPAYVGGRRYYGVLTVK